MKKYIIVTALILSNTAWSMDTKKEDAPKNTTVNTNDIEKIITSSLEETDGMAILDDINAHSGILPKQNHVVKKGGTTSRFFVMNQNPSKL